MLNAEPTIMMICTNSEQNKPPAGRLAVCRKTADAIPHPICGNNLFDRPEGGIDDQGSNDHSPKYRGSHAHKGNAPFMKTLASTTIQENEYFV